MNKLKNTKNIYNEIEIPKELKTIVAESISSIPEKKQPRFYFRPLSYATLATGLAFVIGVNTSDVLAQALNDIPIINVISKIFTIKTYNTANQFNQVDVLVPALYGVPNEEVQNKINAQVEEKINQTVADAKQRSEEYYKDFIAAGNKPSEFLPMDIKVDYEVKSSSDKYVSFIVTSLESYVSALTTKDFYNINLITGNELTLKDLVGKDYVSIINSQVKAQIEQRLEDGELFFEDLGAFESITADQPFYINEYNQLVIVFEKYSIAPGYMGFPEFVIETPVNID